MDTTQIPESVKSALVTLLGAIVTGLVALLGAWVQARVARMNREARDTGAAEEKIRNLEKAAGLPPSENLKSPDAIHDAIRRLEKAVAPNQEVSSVDNPSPAP